MVPFAFLLESFKLSWICFAIKNIESKTLIFSQSSSFSGLQNRSLLSGFIQTICVRVFSNPPQIEKIICKELLMPFLQHNVMTCCSQVILVKVLMFLISLCCCFLRHGGDCQRLSEGQGKKRGNLNPRLVFLPFLATLAALGLPWLMTDSLIVMDSKHSSLPDQTETPQNWLGSFQSDPSRANWWGLTKFHNFGQISQSWNTWS